MQAISSIKQMKRAQIIAVVLSPLLAGAAYWGYGRYQCHTLSAEVLESYDDMATASETKALLANLGVSSDQVAGNADKLADEVRLMALELRLEALAEQCPSDYDATIAMGDERFQEAAGRIL